MTHSGGERCERVETGSSPLLSWYDGPGRGYGLPASGRVNWGEIHVMAPAAPRPPDPFSYAELVQELASGEDWHFAARLLREVVIRCGRITDQAAIDFVHRDPGLTGIRGWDAIIGGVASMTGRGRVSDSAVLHWCFEPDRYCSDEMFDPFDAPDKYFWIDYLRTPVELQVRNVIFPSGNLEGL